MTRTQNDHSLDVHAPHVRKRLGSDTSRIPAHETRQEVKRPSRMGNNHALHRLDTVHRDLVEPPYASHTQPTLYPQCAPSRLRLFLDTYAVKLGTPPHTKNPQTQLFESSFSFFLPPFGFRRKSSRFSAFACLLRNAGTWVYSSRACSTLSSDRRNSESWFWDWITQERPLFSVAFSAPR